MNTINPKYSAIWLIIFLFFSSAAFAHGDLTARINTKTSQISKTPGNATLYYDRGYLYQQHEEYQKALKDFSKAETLGFKNKLLYYRIAQTYNIIGDYGKAINAVSNYFELDANDIKIYKLKAQILIKQKKHDEALVAYDYVLKTTSDLRPDNIIEYCDIILAINPNNYEVALETVVFGLKKTGENTVVLRDKKIEYLAALGKSDEVIEQYNLFLQTSERKESWYYKKAVYLKEVNKNQEANIALQQAKISIQLLNPRFQQTPVIKELSRKVTELEKSLKL